MGLRPHPSPQIQRPPQITQAPLRPSTLAALSPSSAISQRAPLRPSPAEGPWTAEACCRYPGASPLARHQSSSRPSEQAAAGSGLLSALQLSLAHGVRLPALPTSPLRPSPGPRGSVLAQPNKHSPLRPSPPRTSPPQALDCWENHSSPCARSALTRLSPQASSEPSRDREAPHSPPSPPTLLRPSPSNFSLPTSHFQLPTPLPRVCCLFPARSGRATPQTNPPRASRTRIHPVHPVHQVNAVNTVLSCSQTPHAFPSPDPLRTNLHPRNPLQLNPLPHRQQPSDPRHPATPAPTSKRSRKSAAPPHTCRHAPIAIEYTTRYGETINRSGSLAFNASDYPTDGFPNRFGLTIAFDTFFTYSGGNLLLEYTHSVIPNTRFSADASRNIPLAQTQFASGFDGTIESFGGRFDDYAPVVSFTVLPVPEPSSTLLLGLGAFGIPMRRRRTN